MSTVTRRHIDRGALAPSCGCRVSTRGPNWLFLSVDAPLPADGLADRMWELANSQFVYRVVLRFEDGGHVTHPYELAQLAVELRSLCDRLQRHGGVLRLCGLDRELATQVLDETGCPRLHNHASPYDAVWCGDLEEAEPRASRPR